MSAPGGELLFDDRLRVRVFEWLAERGEAPTSEDLAGATGRGRAEVREALARLADRRTVVLEPGTGEIRMAGPFSAVPTRFRVVGRGGAGAWWANCAWDAFGVAATLGISARVETECADCGEPLAVEVDRERGPVGGTGGTGKSESSERRGGEVVHLTVPAARWWEDIGHT